MKRIISLFLVLVMLFSLTAIAFAQGIIPTSDVTTVKKGEQVKVTMTMEEKITGVTTAEFRLAYDENLFEFDFDSSIPGECDIAKSGDVGGQVWNGYVKYTYANTRTAGGTLDAGAVLATLVFTAKADVTAEQAATFTSSVHTFAKADGSHPVSDFSEKALSVTVTPASTEVKGYAVAASAVNLSITVNDKAQVELKISNKDVKTYNAYYMEVSYDTSVLAYESIASTDAKVIDSNGTLKIVGYGADKTCGTDNIVLTFTGKATGEAKVTVTSAKVDVKANAAAQNAPAANITTDVATITVGGYQVTLPDDFTADSMVAEPNKDYTFTAKDTSKKYDFTGSTMGGSDVTVTDNGNGTYTISNVTGELDIKATALVKINLDNQAGAAINGITNGQYVKPNTEINFTATSDAGKELVVTVNDEEITGVNRQGMYSYTIAADKVTGDALNIVVNYKSSTDTITIIETGDAWSDVTLRATWDKGGGQIDMSTAGSTYLLKFKPAAGKTVDDYVVTINGTVMEPKRQGPNYAVSFIPAEVADGGKITIDVSYKKTGPAITVDVAKYLDLDGQSIFLITATCDELTKDKVLAYNEKPMYWSSKYGESGAYAWLVIADGTKNLDALKTEATAAITAVNGTKVEIVYDGDVNQTKSVDINDAQLVWNMYNAEYKADTDFQTVNRLKYLSADINSNKTVDTSDAAAIVNTIVGSN